MNSNQNSAKSLGERLAAARGESFTKPHAETLGDRLDAKRAADAIAAEAERIPANA